MSGTCKIYLLWPQMQQQLLGDVALGHTFITVDIYYTDMSEEVSLKKY